MEWHVTPTQNFFTVVKFLKYGFVQDKSPTHVIGLLLRIIFWDVPIGESFSIDRIFRTEFIHSKGEYLAKNFRAPGWIHTGSKDCWVLLTGIILDKFERELVDIVLFKATRATQYSIATNLAQLFVNLEFYNPATGNFFTFDGEMGLLSKRCGRFQGF